MGGKDTPRGSFAKTPASCLTIEGSSPARRGHPPPLGSWRRSVQHPQGQNMPQRLLPLAVAAALALPAAAQTPQPTPAPGQQPAAGERKVITSSDQLPRRQ